MKKVKFLFFNLFIYLKKKINKIYIITIGRHLSSAYIYTYVHIQNNCLLYYRFCFCLFRILVFFVSLLVNLSWSLITLTMTITLYWAKQKGKTLTTEVQKNRRRRNKFYYILWYFLQVEYSEILQKWSATTIR